MTNSLISIVGPTGIGKTALSIKLAKHYNTEIISADSRQFFKEMNIGTAVPSKIELNTIKHHLIQHKSIKEKYSVGDFEKNALAIIKKVHNHSPTAVLVGGSGLYVKAITEGLDYFPDIDPNIRLQLNQELKSNGLRRLQIQLKQLDKKAFESIAIDNPHRVIRALEICIGTGKPFSSFLSHKPKKRPFKIISIGLLADRNIIYDRINKRVDMMVKNGLIEEAKALYPYKHLNALNTVGYKELFRFFDGEISLDFAISEIKKNTRRFAKRQLTWFKKDHKTKWFDFNTDEDLIIDFIEHEIKNPAN